MKIPFISTPDKPIVNSTQEEMPIADIINNLVIYKNGGAALIMESTSLNFGLLSDLEQQAVIAAYAALLNSLTFPVQIVVRSYRKDITNYIKYLDEAKEHIKNPKLVGIMNGYRKFIMESVKKKNVLSKNFYIVVPFTPLELGVQQSFMAFATKKGPLPFTKSYVVGKSATILFPKRDHIIRQAGRLGLQVRQLNTKDLIQLAYDNYNPVAPEKRAKYDIELEQFVTSK